MGQSSTGVPGCRWAQLHTKVLDTVHTSTNTFEAINGMIEGWLKDEAANVTWECMSDSQW